ncbi:1,3-beta-glucan synthase [Zostera marina]|uniref:1,3-beta-glucan synthase n=1 Tax=Zostera marina TaxID=29655 RepID=A0A0K9PDX7_ZOSMR|nr:1,3-beta-glucan synthase [Zostera marina]
MSQHYFQFFTMLTLLNWFNSTLRQGNITHHEYIQVGKGRDVGLNQIALFEGKVASGNGEQVLSRDVYRLGQLFDFFRMMSFYYTTVGFYFCTMVCSFFIFRKAFTRNLLKKYYTTTYDNFNSSR